MHDDLLLAVNDLFPSLRTRLEELIRIPSVSAAGYDAGEVRRSAEITAQMMRASGLNEVRLLDLEGAHPAVYGEIAGPKGSPTVLLYAHHDVQPPGPAGEWTTDAFEPAEREGRLYGRGSSDDKAGIVIHLGALEAFGEYPPVGIKVLIEGEEEIGSPHLGKFLSAYDTLLAADVIVIADVGNIETGKPSLTTSLRGLVDCEVEVRTLTHAIHSGHAGGAAPDALIVLARILATLHDDSGNVTIDGLIRRDTEKIMTETWWRKSLGVIDNVELLGEDSIESKLWMQPAISVLAIDAPSTSEAINQLVPIARAKISMRIAPGENPEQAMISLATHLENAAPWGAHVKVTPGSTGDAFELDTSSLAYKAFSKAFSIAWGTETSFIGSGGSIPFVAAFSKQFPDASILLTGVSDHMSNTHAPDESVDLEDLRKAVVAEALALRLLAI